jgi:hypothetical protein
MPAESKSRVKYPSKNVNLCLFYASEQAKPLKVYPISHGHSIFAHIPVGGLGGSGGWGESRYTG